MDRDEIESQALLVYAKVMETLRALPWQVRAEACSSLFHNREFCWHCGMEKPDGQYCHCTNDE